MRNLTIKDWNFHNVFGNGRRDVRIENALVQFMSYYRSSHFNDLDFQLYFLFFKLIEDENFFERF